MSAIDDIQDKFDKYSKACSLMIDRDEWLSVLAEIEQLRQERDGLRDTNHALASRLDELRRVRNERDGLRAALQKQRDAWDDLFAHCCSNGVFNAWGNALDCTSLNEAKRAIDNAMAKEQGE